MTKDKALHAWFSGFGLKAYAASAVPGNAALPYLTYTYTAGAWDSRPAALGVDLWFSGDSEAQPNAWADELSRAIGTGGTVVPCDEGYVWLRRGSPWCQSLTDGMDPRIKRRRINITAEYLTTH